jgi:hypothetical protein
MSNESREKLNRPFAAATGSATARLHQVLVEWRAAERAHARAVLCAAHPMRIQELADEMERALHHVRLNVDAEPWSEITRDESPNAEVSEAAGRKGKI